MGSHPSSGGAYGAFCSFDPFSGILGYASYRDPNVLNTLDNYDGSGAFLRQLDINQDELSKAIIGTIGDLDSYQLPDAKGYTSMMRHLTGIDEVYRQRMRDEILGTTAEDFHFLPIPLIGEPAKELSPFWAERMLLMRLMKKEAIS